MLYFLIPVFGKVYANFKLHLAALIPSQTFMVSDFLLNFKQVHCARKLHRTSQKSPVKDSCLSFFEATVLLFREILKLWDHLVGGLSSCLSQSALLEELTVAVPTWRPVTPTSTTSTRCSWTRSSWPGTPPYSTRHSGTIAFQYSSTLEL